MREQRDDDNETIATSDPSGYRNGDSVQPTQRIQTTHCGRHRGHRRRGHHKTLFSVRQQPNLKGEDCDYDLTLFF